MGGCCLGGRLDGFFERHKHQIQPCVLLIPTLNDQASLAEGVSHGRRALWGSTAGRLPSAHHPALQGKCFCICTFSSSWSRNVCPVSLGTHCLAGHHLFDVRGVSFSVFNLKNISLGTQKWRWGRETFPLSLAHPLRFPLISQSWQCHLEADSAI